MAGRGADGGTARAHAVAAPAGYGPRPAAKAPCGIPAGWPAGRHGVGEGR